MRAWHVVVIMFLGLPIAVVLANYLLMHHLFGLGSPWDDWLSIVWWLLINGPVEQRLWNAEQKTSQRDQSSDEGRESK